MTFQDVNDQGNAIDQAYDAFDAQHNPSTGAHDAFHIPKIAARIQGKTTTAIRKQSGDWTINSVSKIATGQFRLTINAQVPTSDDYLVLATHEGGEAFICSWKHVSIGTGTTTFDVYIFSDAGLASDEDFSVTIYGSSV